MHDLLLKAMKADKDTLALLHRQAEADDPYSEYILGEVARMEAQDWEGEANVQERWGVGAIHKNNPSPIRSIICGDANKNATLYEQAEHDDLASKRSLAEACKSEEEQWYGRALKRLSTQADAGDAKAQYHLAKMYVEGRGVSPDRSLFIKWLQASANGEYPEAEKDLASMHAYSNGSDVPIDLDKAENLYLKAANQGLVEAARDLGEFYSNRKQDSAKSAMWYRNAAERGDGYSFRALGYIYAKGAGMPQSWGESYFWGCLAMHCFDGKTHGGTPRNVWASDGPAWVNSDPLEGEMHLTKDEISAIQRRAEQWKPVTTTIPVQPSP